MTLIKPAATVSAQGSQPGATCKTPPINFRYTLSARNPKNCIKNSVRYAPTRRDPNRPAKSAMPQHTAPVNPRRTPTEILRDGGLLAFWLQAEDRHYLLQILPNFAFRIRISQQISRMICGDQFRTAEIKPFASKPGDALGRLQKRLRCATPEATNHLRPDYINLPKKERRASCDFIFFRQTVFRRAAFHYVADVNVFSAQSHRLDHLRKKFSSAAHERLAFNIFIAARPFADENQLRFHAADSENDIRAALVQLAASAIPNRFSNELKGVAFDPIARFEQRRRARRRNYRR